MCATKDVSQILALVIGRVQILEYSYLEEGTGQGVANPVRNTSAELVRSMDARISIDVT